MVLQSYDKLFAPSKAYWAYWQELTEDAVYNGLIIEGWFADKLPPIFSAEKFVSYCNNRKTTSNDLRSDWIRFNCIRSMVNIESSAFQPPLHMSAWPAA